jgi:hypothetical protein
MDSARHFMLCSIATASAYPAGQHPAAEIGVDLKQG